MQLKFCMSPILEKKNQGAKQGLSKYVYKNQLLFGIV